MNDILTAIGIFLIIDLVCLLLLLIIFRKRIMRWFGMFRALGALSVRSLRDPDAPAAAKIVPLVIAAYLLMPADVLPDVVPLLGQLDDLGILILGLHFLLSPERIARIEARWPGSQATFESLRALALRKRTKK